MQNCRQRAAFLYTIYPYVSLRIYHTEKKIYVIQVFDLTEFYILYDVQIL